MHARGSPDGITRLLSRPRKVACGTGPRNCGFNSQGLPIGLQIGGRPFAEETVLKVGHAYEQNTLWHDLSPPNL